MFNKIIEFSVRNKKIVFFLTVVLIIWGVFSMLRLPIDAVPDITNNQVQINTPVPGWSAEEVEKIITYPIEKAVRGIPNAEDVRSLSRTGLSQVTIIFDDSMDIYRARQLISERLQNVSDELPDEAKPAMGPISTGLGEIYQYVVEFKTIETDPEKRFQQLVELRTIQDWFIKPRLVSVKGIAEVNTTGGYERQVHIVPDPVKLSRYGISFKDIENAVSKATQNVGGGYIEQNAEQFVIQAVGFLADKNEILNLPITSMPSMNVITIKDVATVVYGREMRNGTATYNGHEAVLGTVMMMTGENTRTVAELADKKITEIKKDLPENVQIKTVYTRSELVNEVIGTVWHNVLMGAVLIIILLFLLVGNMRAAFITALSIPLSLIITIICMKHFNISGNLMSLGALDFGIIIDGVVIVVDHCLRKIREKVRDKKSLTAEQIDDVVIDSTKEIRKAAGFGQLILIVVFLPIFALVGIEAKTFQPMASAFIFALVGAFILSVTLTPALVSFLLRKNYQEKESKMMNWMERKYQKILAIVLTKSTIIIGACIITICLGLGLFRHIGSEFIPQLQEGSYAFHMIRPQNVSLDMSIALQSKAEKTILEHPDVSHVFTRIGTSEVATDPMGINVSDTYIILKDFGRNVNSKEYAEQLLNQLKNEVPGMTYLASQPIQMRFNELLEGSRADLTIKIFGTDLAKLQEIGEQLEEIIKPISPASDIELDRTGDFPMLSIEPKPGALARYGIKKSDFLDMVTLALSGKDVGHIFEDDKRFPIIIRMNKENRSNIDAIKKIPVPIFGDTVVPLGDIANLTFRNTFASISRDNGYRRATIMVNIRDIDTKSFVDSAQKLVHEKLVLPEGYYVEWGGQYKNLEQASLRFAILIPLTLLIVFFIIFMAFKSFRQTLFIFIGIPFALFGGILGLYIAGINFSISAAIGFIALMGIAVLNGIVLIESFNLSTSDMSKKENIIKASVSRLRPVMMTAMTDVLGFIPMVLSVGVGAEVQKPLAIVIVVGMITSTVLTLIVLPTLYYKFPSKKVVK